MGETLKLDVDGKEPHIHGSFQVNSPPELRSRPLQNSGQTVSQSIDERLGFPCRDKAVQKEGRVWWGGNQTVEERQLDWNRRKRGRKEGRKEGRKGKMGGWEMGLRGD